MKKTLALLPIVLLMLSCAHQHNLIAGDNIRSMVITLDSSQHIAASNPIEITNEDSLHQIIRKLNACDQEPIIFYPTHWIKINYGDGKARTVVCNGSSMNYEGLTYRLKESIQNIIGY